ncbi:MAG: oligosaccharide flippase family protein [Isosphaeraceae bacterium]
MSQKLLLIRNVAWNWAGMICDAATAFLLMPFLIHRLGEGGYGTWVLIGTLSSYFGMLDLGVRGSVGRYVAYHRAREDEAALGAMLSTALLVAVAAGLITLLATLGLPALFLRVFDVPADQVGAVRVSLLLIGVNIALSFPLGLFDGVLWGHQRFDLLNVIEVPTTVLRAVLTIAVVAGGYGIVGLAAMTLFLAALSGAAKAIVSLREMPGLRFSLAGCTRASARELVSYGVSNLLINVARMIRAEVSPALIGSLVGLPAVTFYAVGKRFIDYTERVIFAATGVVTPLTTSLHASGREDEQRDLLLVGGRYCLMMTAFVTGGLILLGRPLIILWLGGRMAGAATLLTILALGEIIPLSQSVSATVLLGMARHRILAWFGFLEVGLGACLAWLLVGSQGLVGVCIAIAVSGALCRGVTLLFASCRLLGIPFAEYLLGAVAPTAAVAIPVMLASAFAIGAVPPDSWLLFLGQSGFYAVLFALGSLAIIKPEHRLLLFGRIRKKPVPA